MKALFERVAVPIGTQATPGTWLARRRLVAIDGMCLDVADTPDNDAFFGRPGVNKGEQAAFPQARVVALAECGTHAVFAAQIGKYRDSEASLAERMLTHVKPGMLLLADRGSSPSPCGAGHQRPARTCCGRSRPTPTGLARSTCRTCPTVPGWPT